MHMLLKKIKLHDCRFSVISRDPWAVLVNEASLQFTQYLSDIFVTHDHNGISEDEETGDNS